MPRSCTKTRATPALCLFALAFAGCLRPTLVGGEVAETMPTPAGAVYRARGCVLADGRMAPAPSGVTWHLSRDGAVLYEREADGSGIAIRNRWTDADGSHFVVAVDDPTRRAEVAYRFDVTAEDGAPIVRWTWEPGSFALGTERGTTRVTSGAPSLRCELRPVAR